MLKIKFGIIQASFLCSFYKHHPSPLVPSRRTGSGNCPLLPLTGRRFPGTAPPDIPLRKNSRARTAVKAASADGGFVPRRRVSRPLQHGSGSVLLPGPYCFSPIELLCRDPDDILCLAHRVAVSPLAPAACPSRADIPIDDPDALAGAAGILFTPFSHLNPLDHRPQQFRRESIYGGIPLRFFGKHPLVGLPMPSDSPDTFLSPEWPPPEPSAPRYNRQRTSGIVQQRPE